MTMAMEAQSRRGTNDGATGSPIEAGSDAASASRSRTTTGARRPRTVVVNLAVLVALGIPCAGCHTPLFRAQSPDAEPVAESEPSGTPLVGDLTFPSGMHYVLVEGVGLVTGLDNTGSDPPPSPERDALKTEMQTHDAMRPDAILASKRTALVVVRGYLPPGVRKGDKIDIEVASPARFETTSLHGGWLMQARLREVAMIDNQVRRGDVDALGGGDVLVNSVFREGASDEPSGLLKGRVLGGGVSTTTRKLGLMIREDSASVRASTMIAAVINERFHHFENGDKLGVAKPVNAKFIELSISPRYRNNVARYVRVVRSISLAESPVDRAARLHQLESKLLEPTTSATAALQLEAIGKDAIETLRKGVRSRDVEVRFYAAEALAYLDDSEAAGPLAEIIAAERAFRWHGLTALATMDHVSAYDGLTGLLSHPSAEARYGAFRAMQARNPRDPLVRGEILADSFAFHILPGTGEPLVHFARTRRPEVVLFGNDLTMAPPPFLLAGRRIMVKKQDARQVKVIRFEAGEEDRVVICPSRLDAVIRAIVELGGRYEEVYEAVRGAKAGNYWPGRLAVNANASSGRVYDRNSSESPPDDGADGYRVTNPVPELFQDRLDGTPDRADPDAPDDRVSADASEAPESTSFLGTIRGWFSPGGTSE